MRTSAIAGAVFFVMLGLSSMPWQRLAAEQTKGVITEPKEGERIKDRRKFRASGWIKAFQEGRKKHFHYWISVADSYKSKLGRKHWPKFAIQENPFSGAIEDGGECKGIGLEEKKVVLLKVEDATNRAFSDWLKKPRPTDVYPHRELNHDHVIDQVTIYFCVDKGQQNEPVRKSAANLDEAK